MTKKNKKVLFLGIDGFDPNIMEVMMEAGALPAFSGLAGQGSYRRLQTMNPPQSPVVWTSIATGKLADKHGILGFSEPTPERIGIRPVASTSRKVKAIWNILTQRGLNTHVVGWWPSHPAEPKIGRAHVRTPVT